MNIKKLNRLTMLGTIIVSLVWLSGCIKQENDAATPETPTQIIKDITAKEAHALIEKNKDNPNFVIIDVRTDREFAQEYIENAINLDYYSENFNETIKNLDKNKTYLIYCRTGRRSRIFSNKMKELDFKDIYNMLGGIAQWKEEGLPTRI